MSPASATTGSTIAKAHLRRVNAGPIRSESDGRWGSGEP